MPTYTDIKKLCKEYDIKPREIAEYIVHAPGKFEGESLATVYFYNGMMDGWTDSDDCIALRESDKRLFNIDSRYAYVHIWQDEQGFCYTEYLTEEEYYSLSFAEDESEDNLLDNESQQENRDSHGLEGFIPNDFNLE